HAHAGRFESSSKMSGSLAVFVCVTDKNVGHMDRSKTLALNAGSYKGSERQHCSKTEQFCNEEFTR
ncbi:MAG: hypothetical protein ACXW52_25775, partial [Candidatus Binatia bacterium]